MCGRAYATYSEEELIFRYLNRKPWPWPIEKLVPDFKPNYNMCPTQIGLALSVHEEKLGFRQMRWGLVPGWAKTVKDADKYSMINAKAEEISEKRSYSAAFRKRRCIVPVSGFFEWKRSTTSKKPFAIFLKEDSIMSLAGVWESWTSKENGEVVESFAVLTTAANSFMENIHTRMPVILGPDKEEAWLDPDVTDELKLKNLLSLCSPDNLGAFEISTKVNSPKNNSSEILKRVE